MFASPERAGARISADAQDAARVMVENFDESFESVRVTKWKFPVLFENAEKDREKLD